jgi:hypothetical protein
MSARFPNPCAGCTSSLCNENHCMLDDKQSPCMETKSPEEITGDIEELKLRFARIEKYLELE